ncbi:DEAD/DEAH box helicase, partial [Streptococcus sanguinis]
MKAQKEEQFRDIFVTAPTGAGKSVMFQIPAIYLAEKSDLVTIVISPLIGLMNDQVNNIQSMTKLAETINSDYTPSQKENVLEQIKNGDKSILYLSPETLLSNTDITNLIGDRKIGLLVVDEAHIVSTWGKSFRPDYWYLGEFISRLRKSEKSNQNFPIATFTATATYGSKDNMYFDI